MCSIRSRNWLPFASTWVHPQFLVGSVLLLIFLWLVCLMLPMSLDYPFSFVPSIFYNVYFYQRISVEENIILGFRFLFWFSSKLLFMFAPKTFIWLPNLSILSVHALNLISTFLFKPRYNIDINTLKMKKKNHTLLNYILCILYIDCNFRWSRMPGKIVCPKTETIFTTWRNNKFLFWEFYL